MALTTNPQGLTARINAAGPNTLADVLRLIGFGTLLRQLRVGLRRQNPFAAPANPYVAPATVTVITLPEDAKAFSISRCYGRAQDASESTGSVGELTVKTPYGTTPTTGTVGITPSGDLMFLTTDAFNDVDIDYDPIKQDIVELILPVVSSTGVCTIPAKYAGAAAPGTNAGPGLVSLLEVESLAGTTTGKFAVLIPGAAPGTTKQANLSAAKMTVLFKASDAVSSCRVKLGVAAAIDTNALLEATSPIF